MPLHALQSFSLNVDVPRRVKEQLQSPQQHHEEEQSELTLPQLPTELQWKILGMAESRPDWRLVSREWSSMVSHYWAHSGHIRLHLSSLAVNLRFDQSGSISSSRLDVCLSQSDGGCLRPLLRPLLQSKQITAYTKEDQVVFRVGGLPLIEQVLQELKACTVGSSTMQWKRKIVPSAQIFSVPFDSLFIEDNNGYWDCSDLITFLQYHDWLLRDYMDNPKLRLNWLASITTSMEICVTSTNQLRRDLADRCFAGVHADEWPSLAVDMMHKGGVEAVALYSEDGSPFNEEIALNFIESLKSVDIDRFSVTLPRNVEDLIEENEGRKTTINSSSRLHTTLVIEKQRNMGLNLDSN